MEPVPEPDFSVDGVDQETWFATTQGQGSIEAPHFTAKAVPVMEAIDKYMYEVDAEIKEFMDEPDHPCLWKDWADSFNHREEEEEGEGED